MSFSAVLESLIIKWNTDEPVNVVWTYVTVEAGLFSE
jgi:hypothetical protein